MVTQRWMARKWGGWHRVPQLNERIRSINEGEVTFTVRADDKGGKRRMRIPETEFVRRFMLHVLPTGSKRIRHYGVLASNCKAVKLAAARQAATARHGLRAGQRQR